MPPVYWTFPAQIPKPAGRVLIARDEKAQGLEPERRPLLVSGMYGVGRIVYMGFDGTWRWRRTPNDARFYRRFWLQMIRYLVEGRSAASQGRGVIETDREGYTLGDRVTIFARRLKDAAYDVLDEPELDAVLQTADGETQKVLLKATTGQQGDYSATITAGRSGLHKIKVQLDSDVPAANDALNTTFRVALPQLETRQTWLNKPLLTELATASGGKYYELNELDQLVAAIPDRAEKVRVRGEPIPLWDNNRALLLLVGLLCAEWAIRKRSRLM